MMNHGFQQNVIFSVFVVDVLELSPHPRNYFHHYSCARLLEHGHSSWMWYTLLAVSINCQKTIPTLQLSIFCRRTLRNDKEDMYWFWAPVTARFSTANNGETPTCSISSVKNNCLGILKNSRKFLPVHPTWNKTSFRTLKQFYNNFLLFFLSSNQLLTFC